MPRTKVKPPNRYLASWHDALNYLAVGDVRPDGRSVLLQSFGNEKEARTAHFKARSMRASVREYPGWPAAVRQMVLAGELSFYRDGQRLYAHRSPALTPLSQIVANIPK